MNKILTSTFLGALIVASPLVVFAQTPAVDAGASSKANVGPAESAIKAKAGTTASIAKTIARADTEITRRITNLHQASIRISATKNISAEQKTSIAASISTEIANLTALKTKIDADTDAAALKTDVQSITDNYRVYALVLPQNHIVAATDRITTIVAQMQQLGTKLNTRITEAQAAGKNVTAAQATYTDMLAKVADASTQSQAALTETQGLKPDNGDAAVKTSNDAAIKDAVTKIKAATADLKAARTDLKFILAAIKGVGASAKGVATSTASTTVKVNAQ